jgi:transposase InsO family protein
MAAGYIEGLFSRPGKPVDNAICESNNGRIRAEFLNTTLFNSLPDVAEKAEHFRLHFNQQRRHSAINNMTPAAYAAQHGLRLPRVGGQFDYVATLERPSRAKAISNSTGLM